MNLMNLRLSDFDYMLPRHLVAHSPTRKRDESRLMVLHPNKVEHKRFCHVLEYLGEDDVLVLNQTRVMAARLDAVKSTGALVQIILLEKKPGTRCWCKLKANRPRKGDVLKLGRHTAQVIDRNDDDFLLEFSSPASIIMNEQGKLPIPWYVKKELDDENRYQTVFSCEEAGSLAAPTAGLHFTQDLLQRIKDKGISIARVNLEISFDTFLPVRTSNILDHEMHEERFSISEEDARVMNSRKGKLFVVGTTCMRALESAAGPEGIRPGCMMTRIYIHPGYIFKAGIDGMITNFHLPKSSLFIMVCGYAGTERMQKAYEEAVSKKYRFYSFGDSMLILK